MDSPQYECADEDSSYPTCYNISYKYYMSMKEP